MFPDLRLLISATVATFFLAATAGLYASLRITQDQIVARSEGRTAIEDNPITRISGGWPMPEQSRAAALRELAKIASVPPVIVDEPASATKEAPQSGAPAPAEDGPQALLNDGPAPDAAGSTGIAVAPEGGVLNQADHPDIQGNIEATPSDNPNASVENDKRPAAKKTLHILRNKKIAKAVQRRRSVAHVPDHQADPALNGYPLYLTVPVTN